MNAVAVWARCIATMLYTPRIRRLALDVAFRNRAEGTSNTRKDRPRSNSGCVYLIEYSAKSETREYPSAMPDKPRWNCRAQTTSSVANTRVRRKKSDSFPRLRKGVSSTKKDCACLWASTDTVAFPKRLSVIVAENNSRKTTIIDALRMMLMPSRDLDALRLTEDDFRNSTSGAPNEISLYFL
jgi:hypothetical protein